MMSATAGDDDPFLPLHQNKVVMVVDLVESVRLMADDEAGVVARWHGFLRHAGTDVLPAHEGRLVKSLGDGFLAEFNRADAAVRAALALQQYFGPANTGLPAERQMHLRVGLNATHLWADDNDVYGHGVNLAARVADLAEPGDIVVTAAVRDLIVDDIDATLEDMGESHLKHWPHPVRTWRARPPGTSWASPRLAPSQLPVQDIRPTIAVIPFDSRSMSTEQWVIGELVADGVIAQLSRSQHLRVISRLSTHGLRGRSCDDQAVRSALDASYTLSGSYVCMGDRMVLMAELSRSADGEVIWAERLTGDAQDLVADESELVGRLAEACAHHLLEAEIQRTLTHPIPRLDSNALMLGGITLMHHSTQRDMNRSRELLEAVIERHKRVAMPWAWLAKWQIIQVVQGGAADPAQAFQQAIDLSDRALDLEPDSSMALAVRGHAMCHLGQDIETSRLLLTKATQTDPNNPIAWLYSGFWSTMWGNPDDAVRDSDSARALSPLDPHRFYLEMLAANGYLVANRHEETIALCLASLKRNRYHTSTLRVLLTAQVESGQMTEAANTFAQIRALQPNLTLSSFMAYGSQSPLRLRGAAALKAMGLS